MSTTRTLSSAAFDELWAEAARRNGLDLLSSRRDLSRYKTIDDMIRILERDKVVLKAFRKKGQKIRDVMKPFASLCRVFVDTGADVAANAGVPGAGTIFSVFSVLLTATKGVSEVYDALDKLLSKLQGFLGRLDAYLADPSAVSPALKDILIRILAQVLEVLALCAKHLDRNVRTYQRIISKRAEEYVAVLLGNNEVQDALKKLDELTSEEQLQLIAETFVTAQKIARDVAEMREESKTTLEQLREELIQTGVTKWLSPPNPEDTHHLVSKARQSETGEWFFGAQFAVWKETKNGVFWIHGKPGSGKSVLFSAIVDKLKRQGVLVYFYFDSKQTVRGLLASIVHQLASQSTACLGLLKKLHANHSQSLSPPSDDKLVDCMNAMLQAVGKVFVLIDALDECPEARRHKDLLPLIQHIAAPNEELCLLVTSRPEVDIQECIAPIVTEQLSLHDVTDQASALARHVASKLASTELYRGWPDELRSQAENVLTSKAGGMFLWADLQLERLRRCHPSAVNKALETLPVTLYETYARILEGIEADNALLAHRIFECIAFAARPLTPEELAESLIMVIDGDEVALKPEYRTTEPELWLLRTCSSLIQIVSGSFDGEDKSLVQFVHFSAQEYLLSVQHSGRLSVYGLTPASSHITLARLCLLVLTSSAPLSDQPFATYAIRYWMIHVKSDVVQEAVNDLLDELLHPHRSSFSRFLEGWTTRTNFSFDWEYPYDKYSTSLYLAAHLGLRSRISALLESYGVDIRVLNTPHAPTVWAAATAGHVDIVQLLLECGANVDACYNDQSTPLYVAAESGHVDIALLLLRRGAAVDARMKDSSTPLSIAVQKGHVEAVRVLLEFGATVDMREKVGWTPLHRATHRGYVEIAHLLLDSGATVDARGVAEWTPLHIAAKYGQVDMASLLLGRSATVDARQQDGITITPLYLAAEFGHVDIVRLLLKYGAAVDTRMEDDSTPLHITAQKGYLEVARVLLEFGATVNVHRRAGWTPLHETAWGGYLEVARLFLNSGADVGACNEGEWTPLHLAAQKGHADVARLLLENGATLDARSTIQWTPLHVAAQEGQVDVARLLLERGGAVDARQSYKQSPLHNAAEYGHFDLVCLLLEQGADINARNRDQDTPLYLAALGGHVDVVRHFLDCNALFKTRTDSGWTVLHGAASKGHIETLKVLLERGADIAWRNHVGRTALLCAAGNGHDAAVRVLLDHGASITACDHLGFGVLDYAAAGGHTAVARLVLERGADIRSENAPHGSCVQVAERASRTGAFEITANRRTWEFRESDAQDVASLLREARPAVARGDRVFRRLRRYRSLGSWGDVWTGSEGGESGTAAVNGLKSFA